MKVCTFFTVFTNLKNQARQNLTRFDRQQLDHELMICIIGETTEEGEWTEHGTVDDVK